MQDADEDYILSVDIERATELAKQRGMRADDYIGYRIGCVFRLRHPAHDDAEGWEWYRRGTGNIEEDGTLTYPQAFTRKKVEEIRRLEATWAQSPPQTPTGLIEAHCCGQMIATVLRDVMTELQRLLAMIQGTRTAAPVAPVPVQDCSPSLPVAPARDRTEPMRQEAEAVSPLSSQEHAVALQVAKGKTNKEIAVALNLSDKTIKNYVANVFQKLKVSRRTELAAWMVQHGGPERAAPPPGLPVKDFQAERLPSPSDADANPAHGRSAELPPPLPNEPPYTSFTELQRRMLPLLAQGYSNTDMGEILGCEDGRIIASNTRAIYHRLRAQTPEEVATWLRNPVPVWSQTRPKSERQERSSEEHTTLMLTEEERQRFARGECALREDLAASVRHVDPSEYGPERVDALLADVRARDGQAPPRRQARRERHSHRQVPAAPQSDPETWLDALSCRRQLLCNFSLEERQILVGTARGESVETLAAVLNKKPYLVARQLAHVKDVLRVWTAQELATMLNRQPPCPCEQLRESARGQTEEQRGESS